MGAKPTKPLGIFQNTLGKKKYIITPMVASHLRHCTLVVLNITNDDPGLNFWSTHLIRVTAVNLLHRANLSDSYVQTRIWWKIPSFLMYLRNTIYAASTHTRAITINLGLKEESHTTYHVIPEEHRPNLLSMGVRAQ